MKQIRRGRSPVFTVAEHLNVQEQIEQRAYKLWLAGGSHQDIALDNWLNAEREVLEDFIIRCQGSLDPSLDGLVIKDFSPVS